MDLVHGLLEWTTHWLPKMNHPEVCGKHKCNDVRTRTKDVIDWQTQLRNTCDETDLIPNWTFVTKYYNRNKGNELLFSFGTANDPGPQMIPTKYMEWHGFIWEEGENIFLKKVTHKKMFYHVKRNIPHLLFLVFEGYWLRKTVYVSPREVRGRSAGSFPEQRLVIEPTVCGVMWMWCAEILPLRVLLPSLPEK